MMAVPIVDGIDWDNFRYHPVYGAAHHRGIFEWGFLYKESQVPRKELMRREHNSEPYRYSYYIYPKYKNSILYLSKTLNISILLPKTARLSGKQYRP